MKKFLIDAACVILWIIACLALGAAYALKF